MPRSFKLLVGSLTVVGLLVVLSASAAQAAVGGVVPDVPTGTPSPHAPAAPAAPVGANVDWHGGPVMHSNRTHVIFWNPSNKSLSFDSGYQNLISGFLTNVAGDSHKPTNVFALTGQYTDSTGHAIYDSTHAGDLLDTDAAPANDCTLPPAPPTSTGPTLPDGTTLWPVCLKDSDLRSELATFIAGHGLPTGLGDIYFLVTPDGFGTCQGAGPNNCSVAGGGTIPTPVTGSFCGYHSAFAFGSSVVIYANEPYNAVPNHCRSGNPRPNANAADPTISTVSHEQIESITDPLLNAWFDTPAGNEVADLCAGNFGPALGGSGGSVYDQVIGFGHYFLQEEWSNEDSGGTTNAALGCRAQDEGPSVQFSVTAPVASGRPARFTGTASDPDGSIVTYSWSFGDGASGSGASVLHTYRGTGRRTVTLTVTDSAGLRSSLSKQVVVNDVPRAAFAVKTKHPAARAPITFSGASSRDPDGSIRTYRWDFGDHHSARGVSPQHTYRKPGTYTVKLTVVDSAGVSALVVHRVRVSYPKIIKVAGLRNRRGNFLLVTVSGPGTLTINGSRFRIRNAGTPTFKITISAFQLNKLQSTGRVRLRIAIEFQPVVGKTTKHTYTITLRR